MLELKFELFKAEFGVFSPLTVAVGVLGKHLTFMSHYPTDWNLMSWLNALAPRGSLGLKDGMPYISFLGLALGWD